MSEIPLLEIEDLTLDVGETPLRVVEGFRLRLAPGEIVGIVGESGSGKTLAARTIMRLEPPAIRRAAGTVRFRGRDVFSMPPAELRALRGAEIGMVFQEPMASLNPSMRIGRQLEEGLALHHRSSAAERRRQIEGMLSRVGIADVERALGAYPHEFSGGMRQRIMLASVMLLKPALLIADEPTTALDAVVQRDVLELMLALTREQGAALLLISHDLAMVARYTSRVIVMEKGRIVEEGPTGRLLSRPAHEYTRKLLSAMPRRGAARSPVLAEPMIEVRNLVVEFGGRRSWFRKGEGKRALSGVTLSVRPGETVAVVGGSGSGKTTLGRSIVGLTAPTSGEILYRGRPAVTDRETFRDFRRNCQMVFQDPYSSLDPRMNVGALIGEALRKEPGLSREEKRARVLEVAAEVGLPDTLLGRLPHELSGGQRQRVAIARAVVRRPAFVVADEPVSALDMTVRAQVLDLFASLQKKHGFACLFVSHDLSVVEQVADRIIVMNEGRIVEEGDRNAIFDDPRSEYTRRLLSAIPALDSTADGGVRLRCRFGEESAPTASASAG